MKTLSATVLLCAALVTSAAGADDGTASRQASKHFQHAVSLYGEADYRAALVEFKRAYTLAPNPSVLYNVGETQYELQDYAGALTTFEHFLAEAAAGDAHRPEVDADLEVLRARVGHVTIVTVPPGADVTVDDQPAGKTPLDRPLLVSIGHRKVVAAIGGRAPITRYVDVAADDNLSITLQLPDAPEAVPGLETSSNPVDAVGAPHGNRTWRIVGWSTAGALAAGAVTFGVLAILESRDLATARDAFPASSQTLSHDSQLTTTYSVVADSLAAAAVVVGSVTLLSTWLSSSGAPRTGSSGATRIMLGPTSLRLQTTF
jgi:PEGA domain